ncbi:hypothetical protein [Alistipes timonensis]
MSALERIMRATGRKPINCKCKICQSFCQTPCLGTPEDILRLFDAGYGDKLKLTYWGVGMLYGMLNYPILMVQLSHQPTGCVLFRNGLCELHELGLKPTEGRLAHHILTSENLSFRKSLSWNVAREWLRKENESVIKEVFERLEGFKKQTGMKT